MNETMMAQEIAQIPDVVARQTGSGVARYREIGQRLRRLDPPVVVTAARGSSDHAALYFKYLVETRIGRPVASMGPSVTSVYGARLRLAGAAMLAVSQSGASPDILSLLEAGRAGGALTVALVNAENAPAGDRVDLLAPLLAGPEVAVAATKSYVASLVAGAAIAAEWAEDKALASALDALPDALGQAVAADWSRAIDAFAVPGTVFCVGRGPGLSIAAEAALKFKETCGLHAEAYSTAEVLHGPVALAEPGLRALVFLAEDDARPGILDTAARLAETGAQVWCAGEGRDRMAVPAAPHPALAPICQAAAFYAFAEKLARRLGRDPDKPAHLSKVTRTV